MHGAHLGVATFLAGLALDKQQPRLPSAQMMLDATALAAVNLLVIGPAMYARVARFTTPRAAFRRVTDAVGLVLVHSGLYALAHRAMHKCAFLRPIHSDHHRFKSIVVPTAANAVSAQEFVFAYMSPFVVGLVLLRPALASLDMAVAVVSLCNLIVHTPSLRSVRLPKWVVHPSDHLLHHRTRAPYYAAPTIAWKSFKR